MKGLPLGMTAMAHADPSAPWVSQDGFLFHPETGLTYTLNPTGVVILDLLRGGSSLTEILKTLVERFDVDLSTARTDLQDFVGQLRSQGLHDVTGRP